MNLAFNLDGLGVDAGEPELLLPEGVQDVVGHDSLHVVDLGRELELLYQTGDHHGSGCAGNSALRNNIAKMN